MRPDKAATELKVPSHHNWRTTDEDEINRRRARALTEDFKISNADPRHPIFSNFRVRSGSGLTYSVEIRELTPRQAACDCVDFHINGLGTCKHVEAVLLHLQSRFKKLFQTAITSGSTRLDVLPEPSGGSLRLLHCEGRLPAALRRSSSSSGPRVGRRESLARARQPRPSPPAAPFGLLEECAGTAQTIQPRPGSLVETRSRLPGGCVMCQVHNLDSSERGHSCPL
jgi:hypothetical protein